jgi:hypothetical protein
MLATHQLRLVFGAAVGANWLDWEVAIYDIFNAAVRAINLSLVVSAQSWQNSTAFLVLC